MRVLIIDDSDLKASTVERAVQTVFPKAQIERAINYKNGKEKLMDDEYDLLCLDWEFPEKDGFPAKVMGDKILEFINGYMMDIPVIICSGANIKEQGELFDKVVSRVYVHPLDTDPDKIIDALRRIRI